MKLSPVDIFLREQHRRYDALSNGEEFIPSFSIDPTKLKTLTRGPLGAEINATQILDPNNSKSLLKQLADEREV